VGREDFECLCHASFHSSRCFFFYFVLTAQNCFPLHS
jgi:hypothetical protein